MKDYYQLLEISITATPTEVKKAYRQLSMRYHPDKNQGHPHFNDLFIQVKEAYEVLSDENRRKHYDYILQQYTQTPKSQQQTHKQETFIQPLIDYFYINTNQFEIGDVIEFQWQTQHADVVEIRPFGKVAASGTKKFKITQANQSIIVELVALNTISQRYAMSNIQLYKKATQTNSAQNQEEAAQKFYEALRQKYPDIDARHFQKDQSFSIYGRMNVAKYRLSIIAITGVSIALWNFIKVHLLIENIFFLVLFGFLFTYLTTCTIRRLHDLNATGKFAAILFIPFINLIFITYLCIPKGSHQINRYGLPIK